MRALLIILALLCSASAGAIELTLVETVQGNVYDADADRVLYSDANQDLRILDRESRAETIIDNPYTGNNPDRANLTPRGAIFTARSNATAVTVCSIMPPATDHVAVHRFSIVAGRGGRVGNLERGADTGPPQSADGHEPGYFGGGR